MSIDFETEPAAGVADFIGTAENIPGGPFKIGSVQFENPFFLAPLAGITDAPFRRICRHFGAGAVYSEMVSSKGLWYNDKNAEALLRIYDDELPVILQIFGSDTETMSYAAEVLRERRNYMLDINMGCPVPKVVKNGDGSDLLRHPEKISKIVEAVVLKAGKPVTVKMRTGWNDSTINAVENAKRIEAAGAAAICVHGRTRMQYYSGLADRKVIGDVCKAVSIPVIGNGDIFDIASAADMFERTGCRAIMIARGALGNPWIFKSLRDACSYEPPIAEKISVMKKHLQYMVEEKGEYAGVRAMRKHISWYVKGLHGAASVRRHINTIENASQMNDVLDALIETNADEY